MQKEWIAKVGRLPKAAQLAVRRELGLGAGRLPRLLQQGPWCQADVVLALLKDGGRVERRAAEQLAGVKVTRLKSAVPPWPPVPVKRAVPGGDDRKITVVGDNPYARPGKSQEDWSRLVVGRTVAEYLRKGGTRRLLRDAVNSGRVELENSRG